MNRTTRKSVRASGALRTVVTFHRKPLLGHGHRRAGARGDNPPQPAPPLPGPGLSGGAACSALQAHSWAEDGTRTAERPSIWTPPASPSQPPATPLPPLARSACHTAARAACPHDGSLHTRSLGTTFHDRPDVSLPAGLGTRPVGLHGPKAASAAAPTDAVLAASVPTADSPHLSVHG